MRNFIRSGLALAFLLLPFLGFSQNYALFSETNPRIPQENLESFIDQFDNEKSDAVNGYIFRYIQFYQTPVQEKKEALQASGIRLLEYFPNYAFIAAIPANYDVAQLRNYNIRSIVPLEAADKMSKRLIERPLPDYALRGNDIEVILTYHSNLDLAFAKSQLEAFPGAMITADYAYSSKITLLIPVSSMETLAEKPWVRYLEPVDPPAEPENFGGRTLHRSNAIATDYGAGRQYDGSGVVVAMGDDGFIGPHLDYQGRINQSNATASTGNHGDHVAGTIMGAGNLNPLHRGMAFGATLMVYDVWDAVNNSPTSHVNDGVMITSTSYSNGCNAGYTSFARTADQQIRQNPSLLHVFSAGNSGTSDCGYGAGSNWGNVTGGVKIGKNVIAVGNLSNTDLIASSSSRGPAEDGRIKPEVCAKGTAVMSTIDVNDYASFTGTSMACPGVSGTTAQLYHAYRSLNSGNDPESALIRGLLMNTAEDLGNPGPDFIHGFGRINALHAVKTLENNWFVSGSVSQGNTNNHVIAVPSGVKKLRIMVVWTDWEGSLGTQFALVNDLQMQVTDPGATVWNPWILDHTANVANLNANATRGIDSLNNQEQVTLDNPAAGTYTVSVLGKNVPQGPQKYWVLYYFETDEVTVTYPIGGEGLVPNEVEVIRWDASGTTGTFDLEYSTNNGSSWNSIATGVSGSDRDFSWTVPSTLTGEALVRVTRGLISDESDTVFAIIGVPQNVNVSVSCPNYAVLEWNAVPGAASYEVSMLGVEYMDSIGTTTGTSFQINGVSQTQEAWFSVRAVMSNGARGRRAIAVQKAPGLWNCPIPDDPGVSELLVPGKGILMNCMDLSAIQLEIEIENYSPNTLTNIPVSYRINGGTVVNETYTGSLPGYGMDVHTFTSTVNLSGTGNYTIETWVNLPADANKLNDTVTTEVKVVGGTTVNPQYSENFETFNLCSTSSNCESVVCNLSGGWLNYDNIDYDDIDWRVNEGTTPSFNTGPSVDKNPGTAAGNYLYLEASSCFEKTGMVISPCIDLSMYLDPELSFWFHLNGGDMGTLHVDLLVDGGWVMDVTTPMTTNWFDTWWNRTVDLSAYAGKTVNVRFRGETGPDYQSDMAIDWIEVTGSVVGMDEEQLQGGLSVYPNPGTGIFNIDLMDAAGDHVEIEVMDMQGRTVYQSDSRLTNGDFSGKIDLTAVSLGIYFLKLKLQDGVKVVKLVKE